jgi:hypothetical protein
VPGHVHVVELDGGQISVVELPATAALLPKVVGTAHLGAQTLPPLSHVWMPEPVVPVRRRPASGSSHHAAHCCEDICSQEVAADDSRRAGAWSKVSGGRPLLIYHVQLKAIGCIHQSWGPHHCSASESHSSRRSIHPRPGKKSVRSMRSGSLTNALCPWSFQLDTHNSDGSCMCKPVHHQCHFLKSVALMSMTPSCADSPHMAQAPDAA